MKILDAKWTDMGNLIFVKCECGSEFWWPMRISDMVCFVCMKKNYWHEGNWGDYPTAEQLCH